MTGNNETIKALRERLNEILNEIARHISYLNPILNYPADQHFLCKPSELSTLIREEIPEWFVDFLEEDQGLSDEEIIVKIYGNDIDFSLQKEIDFVVHFCGGDRRLCILLTVDDFDDEIEIQQENLNHLQGNPTDI